MLDTAIQVRTDHFDGPLALLLHLIEKEEMSIKSLDMRVITGQYLSFITQMQEMNFDMAGDYLYLAATLLFLKSNACISDEDQATLAQFGDGNNLNITSQAELIRRLEELQHFQRMAQKLWNLPKKGHQVFTHPKIDRKVIVNSILTPMEMQTLTMAMIDILRREKRKFAVVRRDRLSIKEKLQSLKKLLKSGESTDLDQLIDCDGTRSTENIVITFISVLELARLRKLSIFQNESNSKVYINVLESLENLDVSQATGFDEEQGSNGAAPEASNAELSKAEQEEQVAPAPVEVAFTGEVDPDESIDDSSQIDEDLIKDLRAEIEMDHLNDKELEAQPEDSDNKNSSLSTLETLGAQNAQHSQDSNFPSSASEEESWKGKDDDILQ